MSKDGRINPGVALTGFSGVGAGDLVLDVGTGTGIVAAYAALLGARVVALDINLNELLTNGWQDFGRKSIRRVMGDYERLPFAEGTFDAVVGGFSHTVTDNLSKHISELARVTKPGGIICLSQWQQKNDPSILIQTLTSETQNMLSNVEVVIRAVRIWADLGEQSELRHYILVRIEIAKYQSPAPQSTQPSRGSMARLLNVQSKDTDH
jgi:ubiquinone/menaquinone biosynthesis C-methylase UbiE